MEPPKLGHAIHCLWPMLCSAQSFRRAPNARVLLSRTPSRHGGSPWWLDAVITASRSSRREIPAGTSSSSALPPPEATSSSTS